MKTELEEKTTPPRAASNSPEDDSRHLTPHASKSNKISYRCRMIKSSRNTRTLNDERKHASREGQSDVPDSIPDKDEEEEENEEGEKKAATASIGKPTINLFTSFQCKGQKGGLLPYTRTEEKQEK